jgi:pyridoxal phosphate enzyme (YggS family)
MAAYESGARHYRANYMNELCEKAPLLPPDIQWPFIGTLQSNKAKKLVLAVPNLAVVETVDTLKLAKKLNDAAGEIGRTLHVYLQINTSGEDTKTGTGPDGAVALATAVRSGCPHLTVAGLMTIGAPGDAGCFDTLARCRAEVAAAFGVAPESLALSMGMSGDFEAAIARGSTSVRVGSSIFGAREYPIKDAN